MQKEPQICIFDQTQDIFAFIFQQWQSASATALQARNQFTVALSGGRTPAPLYAYLAQNGRKLPWHQTHLFQVDERFVPLEHPDSNFCQIQETLLSAVSMPQDQVHVIPRDQPLTDSAATYDAHIRRFFKKQEPRLDCVLLGMGDDGHTASLFPGQAALSEQEAFVIPVQYAPVKHSRISMTFPLLNLSRLIIFLVLGTGKAEILKAVIRDKDPRYPAAKIQPLDGDLIFVLDRAAGRYL